MSETYLQRRIYETIKDVCPAFVYNKNEGAALWHRCKCAAGDTCICVWHTTSKCEAGKWPQLSFVDAKLAAIQKEKNGILKLAKDAIDKAK